MKLIKIIENIDVLKKENKTIESGDNYSEWIVALIPSKENLDLVLTKYDEKKKSCFGLKIKKIEKYNLYKIEKIDGKDAIMLMPIMEGAENYNSILK